MSTHLFARGLRRSLLRRRNERAIESQALVRVRRMPAWQSTLVALAGLVFVLGVALGEMEGVGVLLHALDPARHMNIFYALHNQLVVGCLVGVSLLWLLPPHPWAQRLVEATARAAPRDGAGEAGAGERGTVAALSRKQGRDPPPRRPGAQEVGG